MIIKTPQPDVEERLVVVPPNAVRQPRPQGGRVTRREVIAYAITHAPKGVKGGPYTGNGSTANQVPSMALARRYALEDLHEAQADVAWLVRNEYTARVIRIVRKARPCGPFPICPACGIDAHGGRDPRPSIAMRAPSEASAVEVLRELVAWDGGLLPCFFDDIFVRARAVLAGAGLDPMPVVRAAMRFSALCTPALEGSAWFEATREFIDAVEAYRKAGGK